MMEGMKKLCMVRPFSKSSSVKQDSWGRIPQERPGAGFPSHDENAHGLLRIGSSLVDCPNLQQRARPFLRIEASDRNLARDEEGALDEVAVGG